MDARALLAGRGVTRYTRELLLSLAERFPGDEWLAFVPGRRPVAPVHPGVRVVRHRLGGRVLFGAAAVAGRPTLAELLGGVDVVWLPAPAPVTPGAPYVLSVHDRSWEQRPGDFTPYERAWHHLARPRTLARHAEVVTAVSNAVAGELAAEWSIAARVVSPGVRAPAEAGAPGGAATPRDAALPGGATTPRDAAAAGGAARRPYFLSVAPREPRKAPEVLDAGVARARARGLDAELVVVGDGPAVGEAELAALYTGALAVVAPSHLEGFGLPPLEAAAHGTPAVVSDLAAFAETLGDAALRVAPGDAEALATALLEMAGDPALRARLGAAARERAAAYTWERAADALHEALREAAGR